MSLIGDLISFENPSVWNDFGGTSGGFAGVVWQMAIWSIIVAILVTGWMIYNLIYFRHTEGDPDHKDALKAGVFPHERGNAKIEIAWTIAPLILVSWLTFISLAPLDYLWDVDGQEEDLTIEVEAGQWYWQFGTPLCSEKGNENSWCVDGLYQQPPSLDKCKSNIDCLEIPHGAVVHFRLTSKDVLHAFNFPEIGIKQDVVPNLETLAWLDTNEVETGQYSLWCAEYCGDDHSKMDAAVYITEVQ